MKCAWPFQRVRRPGSITTGRGSSTSPQRSASSAVRAPETAAGSKAAMSAPRGMTTTSASGRRARIILAMNSETAITGRPRPMIRL